jgi:two-component system response regulator YesN
MYKVLVVDDEKIGRSGISFLLNQLPYDFEITECVNGLEALQQAIQEEYQFLLTDIRMPKMDGLELIKALRQASQSIQCLILSGYSDFEYAKKAISLGVKEYLLKPVDPDEFDATITRMIDEYEDWKKEQYSSLRSKEIMQEYTLLSLINGKKDKLTQADLAMVPNYSRLMLIEFDHAFFDSHFDFEQFLAQYLDDGWFYLNLDFEQSLLFFELNQPGLLSRTARALIENVQKEYHQHCYIALSGLVESMEDLPAAYSRLQDSIMEKFEEPSTYLFLPLENNRTFYKTNMDTLSRALSQDLASRNIEKMREHLNDFFESKEVYGQYLSDYSKYLLADFLRSAQKQLDAEGVDISKDISRLYHYGSADKIQECMNGIVNKLADKFEKNEPLVHKEVESIKKYIFANYSQDLSVDQLADYVCLAPSYLSHIFKKETGENLGKFIKRVRMEKARDMLEGTYEKIITISSAVGYQNVSYFCQSFREYYGISPQKFRNKGESL